MKIVSVVDPGPELARFERFERINDALYLYPMVGANAAQSAQRIAGAATKTLASRDTQSGTYRIEVWKHATKDAKEERLGVLADYDRSKTQVGSLTSGSFVRLDLPKERGGALRVATTWAIGLEAGERLSDADGDGVPTAHDNCAWTANRDQLDKNGNGIGEACEPASQR